MIAELAAETEPFAAAKMHVDGRGREHVKADELRSQKLFQHAMTLENISRNFNSSLLSRQVAGPARPLCAGCTGKAASR